MSMPIRPHQPSYGSMDSTTALTSEGKKEARLKAIATEKADLQQRIETIRKSRATDSNSPYIKSDETGLKAKIAELTDEAKVLKGDSGSCTVT